MSNGKLKGRKVKFYNAKNKLLTGTIVEVFVGSTQMVLYFLLLMEDSTFIQKLPESCTLLPEEPNPAYAKFGLVDPAFPTPTPSPAPAFGGADLRDFNYEIH